MGCLLVFLDAVFGLFFFLFWFFFLGGGGGGVKLSDIHTCVCPSGKIYCENLLTFKPSMKICSYHECEGRIEKSITKIRIWHHESCRVMTNGDPKGWIYLSYPHTNN